MGRLVVGAFVTLDGVMQAPGAPDEDREGGFEHGGWLVPHFDEELGELMSAATERAEALLLGRKTYEIFASHWPLVTDEDDRIAAVLNRIPKFVVSRTLERAGWEGTTVIRERVVEEIQALKGRFTGEIHVAGSSDLVQTLLAYDLVDELRILTFPVLVGPGKRLFGSGTLPAGLRLLESRTLPTGVTMTAYEPAGAVETGAIGLETQG